MRFDVILRVATKFMLAPVLLFALYVQLHGDYGPGGGFQAGVIAAAAVILYGLIVGLAPVQRIVPMRLLEVMIPGGVLVYMAVGIAGLLLGDNFLDYDRLAHDAVHGQEWGVFLVEVGVFLTVFSTMIAIFYAFAGRGRS
jgi:multicomponent Na+:H+ antiporter subunit B